jgi:cytochrome c biogenesis protein CcdA
LEGGTAGVVALVFTAGLLSFFSPCILPLLPVYLGALSADESLTHPSPKASLAKAAAFTAGLAAPLFLLGAGAGALAAFINTPRFFLACGVLVVIFGIHQTGLRMPFLRDACPKNGVAIPQGGLPGAFALGFLFSFGWTPCTGPLLAAVSGLASQQGGALGGGGLLLVYSLGVGLPFVVLACCSRQILRRIEWIYPHFPKIRIAGGILIIVMGGWMIFNQARLLI